jgi:pyruvate kinase
MRLGCIAGGTAMLEAGERVVLTTRDEIGNAGRLPTAYQHLPRDVRRGNEILIDDGRVRLRVERVRRTDVECRVLVGGPVSDHKGINLPGAHVSAPALTAKDKEDLAFGRSLGVDYVALSFVRSAADIREARRLLRGAHTGVIAKIERPQAVDALDAIAAEADGVMIARGDLGVELPLQRVPLVQKDAIDLARRLSRIVIVATEMLDSMIREPRPTRAEVSDVANAILDGADAVMLSGETAVGAHAVDAVRTMAKIVEEVESSERYRDRLTQKPGRNPSAPAAVARAACAAADELGLETIVAYTETGATAHAIADFRPQARIVALTPRPETRGRVALYWGVLGISVARCRSTDAMLAQVSPVLLQRGLGRKGELVAVAAGVPVGRPGTTNSLTLHRL